MSKRQLLPGFNTASGANRHLVTVPELPERLPPLSLVSESDLMGKRVIARSLQPRPDLSRIAMATNTNVDAMTVRERWSELVYTSNVWLEGHLRGIILPNYDPGHFSSSDEAKNHAIKAAKDGYATCGAIIEVVPKVLYDRTFDDPNTEIADWASRSVGMAVEWLGLDPEVDEPLAGALSDVWPEVNESAFHDLHFGEMWFEADDRTRSVSLHAERAAALLDRTRYEHPAEKQRPVETLFGCPARKWIPGMYQAMVGLAMEQCLFQDTYNEHRAARLQ